MTSAVATCARTDGRDPHIARRIAVETPGDIAGTGSVIAFVMGRRIWASICARYDRIDAPTRLRRSAPAARPVSLPFHAERLTGLFHRSAMIEPTCPAWKIDALAVSVTLPVCAEA